MGSENRSNTGKFINKHERLPRSKKMVDALTADQLKEKVRTLIEEKGILTQLRTHLRKLIVCELQSESPSNPPCSLKVRACASLVLDWLRKQGFHYTLSVLASEMPSLVDLPGFTGEASPRKYQEDEAREILHAFDLKYDEIISNYTSSSEALLICILDWVAMKMTTISFREHCSEDFVLDEEWCEPLRDVLIAVNINPSQMVPAYNAIRKFFKEWITKIISKERDVYHQELIDREKNIQSQLQKHNEEIERRLNEAEEKLASTKDSAEDELNTMRDSINDLLKEVQEQHQEVVMGLATLESAEKEFQSKKRRIEMEIEDQVSRLRAKTEMIDRRERELEKAKVDLEQREGIVSNQSKLITRAEGRSRSPISTLSSSSSKSQVTSEKSQSVLKRLRELREETRRGRDVFFSRRAEVRSSDSSDDDLINENILRIPKKREYRRQITYPHRHEGSHSGALAAMSHLAISRSGCNGDLTPRSRHSRIPRRTSANTLQLDETPRVNCSLFPSNNPDEQTGRHFELAEIEANDLQPVRNISNSNVFSMTHIEERLLENLRPEDTTYSPKNQTATEIKSNNFQPVRSNSNANAMNALEERLAQNLRPEDTTYFPPKKAAIETNFNVSAMVALEERLQDSLRPEDTTYSPKKKAETETTSSNVNAMTALEERLQESLRSENTSYPPKNKTHLPSVQDVLVSAVSFVSRGDNVVPTTPRDIVHVPTPLQTEPFYVGVQGTLESKEKRSELGLRQIAVHSSPDVSEGEIVSVGQKSPSSFWS